MAKKVTQIQHNTDTKLLIIYSCGTKTLVVANHLQVLLTQLCETQCHIRDNKILRQRVQIDSLEYVCNIILTDSDSVTNA